MRTVLITGAAGFIGNHFSRYLLDKGYHVVGLDDLSGGYKDLTDPRVSFYKAQLGNKDDLSILNGIFDLKKPDYVFHFAAYAAVGLSPFIRRFNYTNNIVGSADLINACINHGTKKIIFASSMDVYGSQSSPFTEDMKPSPEDPYGISKYAVEQDLAAARRFFNLDYSIVRPHNVFGIYQNIWDKYRNVLGIWIRQTLAGQPITIYGDGSQIRSFSDVKYYMKPFEKLMQIGSGEIYNIGADSKLTIKNAADRFCCVAQKLGYNPAIVNLEPRDEVQVAYCDHKKAKEHLDFKDETDFEDLVEKMFVWAKNQPKRQIKIMNYEIEKNLYSYWKV